MQADFRDSSTLKCLLRCSSDHHGRENFSNVLVGLALIFIEPQIIPFAEIYAFGDFLTGILQFFSSQTEEENLNQTADEEIGSRRKLFQRIVFKIKNFIDWKAYDETWADKLQKHLSWDDFVEEFELPGIEIWEKFVWDIFTTYDNNSWWCAANLTKLTFTACKLSV